MRNVYLDYSATTPVKDQVLQEMIPYFTEKFGNPSSLYDKGLESKDAVTHAREQVAELINAKPSEIFFTAGGTEADNWGLKPLPYASALIETGKDKNVSNIREHSFLCPVGHKQIVSYKATFGNERRQ